MQITIYYKNKKLIEPYLSLFKEYQKRLAPYAKLELKTGSKKIKVIKDDYTININHNSKALSSEEFAEKIKDLNLNACTKIGFYINDDNEGKDFNFALLHNKINDEMSISILVEQLYRAYAILNNKTYHK